MPVGDANPRQLTFGEHLGELRSHLLRCIIYLAIGTGVCLAFQNQIMAIIVQPHIWAQERLGPQRRLILLEQDLGEEAAKTIDGIYNRLGTLRSSQRDLIQKVTSLEGDKAALYPEALERRLEALDSEKAEIEKILETTTNDPGSAPDEGVIVRLFNLNHGITVLEADIERLVRPGGRSSRRKSGESLRALRYQDAFLAHLKMSIIAALFLMSFPIGLEIWWFVGEGLKKKERKWVLRAAPFSIGLFIGGVLFGFFILIPLGLWFLASYGDPGAIDVTITLPEYLNLVTLMTLVVGLVFQLPLIQIFGSRIGIWDAKKLAGNRKYFVLMAFTISAILTPPDPVTMLLMAGPLILLYELGIILIRLFPAEKTKG